MSCQRLALLAFILAKAAAIPGDGPELSTTAAVGSCAAGALGTEGCPATGRSVLQYAHTKTSADEKSAVAEVASTEEYVEVPTGSMAQQSTGSVSVHEAVRKVGQARRDFETAALLAESRRAAAKTEVAKALEKEADAETGAAEQLAKAERSVAAALKEEAAARLDAAQAEDETAPEPTKLVPEEMPRFVSPSPPAPVAASQSDTVVGTVPSTHSFAREATDSTHLFAREATDNTHSFAREATDSTHSFAREAADVRTVMHSREETSHDPTPIRSKGPVSPRPFVASAERERVERVREERGVSKKEA